MKNLCAFTGFRAGICLRLVLFLSVLTIAVLPATAQLAVNTDRNTAVYDKGESIQFLISSSVNGTATYTITHDKYTSVLQSGTINLQGGSPQPVTFSSAEPALVVCTVVQNGQTAKAAAAIAPLDLEALEDEPADFDAFWEAARSQLLPIPIDPQLTFYNSTPYSTTYKINLATIKGRRVYGYLSIPVGTGPFPAILTLPAFGSGPNVTMPDYSIAEKGGALSMSISIHNAEPDQVDASAYQPDDITDPNNMYDLLAVLAGVRAIDYLFSRSDFDGQHLGVTGVSQGGGLAIMLAGIDQRVNLLVHSNSTHCQHSGLKYDKASGFPYYLQRSRSEVGTIAHEQATLTATKYFDAIYFARRYHGPSLAVVSYQDDVCPPATVFSAWNEMGGKKVLLNARILGHNHPAEYWEGRFDFFRHHFPAMNNPPWPWPATTTGYAIDAGADRIVRTAETVSLSGSIGFNGALLGNLPVRWTVVEGPGNVSFTGPDTYNPVVTFSEAGTYKLRFTAQDYQRIPIDAKFYTLSDELEIIANDDGDDVPPQASLTTPSPDVNGSFLLTITFNELVLGFEAADLNLTNATPSNLNGGGMVYSMLITPVQEGEIRIDLPAGTLQDLAGNFNTASNLLIVNFKLADTVRPTVALSTAATEVSGVFEVLAAFSEDISGLLASDFLVSNGLVTSMTGFGQSYQLQVSPYNPGQLSIALPAGTVADSAGNFNAVSNLLIVQYIEEDTSAPTGMLSTPSMSVSGDFQVQLAFDEEITGLEPADFILNNATAIALNGSGKNYEGTFRPLSPGKVFIVLPAGTVKDLAGNDNAVSNVLELDYLDPNAEVLLLIANGSGRKVVINWATNTEFKNRRFELQRSKDSIDFVTILEQESENNGTILYNYSFIDLAPFSGENYYRVKQVFMDSSFIFSNIKQLYLDFDLDAFVIFPNPTSDKVFINLRAFAGERGEIDVRNQAGYPVLFRKLDEIPEQPLQFDLEGFQNGIYYFLFSIKGTKRFSRKLILMR